MLGFKLRQSVGIAARIGTRTPLPRRLPTAAVHQAAIASSRAQLQLRPQLLAGLKPWSQPDAFPNQRMISTVTEQPATENVSAVASAPIQTAGEVVEKAKNTSLVFDLGLSVVVVHYQHILVGTFRCLFAAWRPMLILFGFSQIIKAVFFIAGAPIWFSFYSIWMFEVFYGLLQCGLSFLFVAFYYNNLSFSRIRPALFQMIKQQRESVSRAARLVGC